MSDTKDIEAMIRETERMVDDIIWQRLRTTMSIAARPETDTDIVMSRRFEAILAAFAERDARIAELEADAERYQWLFDHDDSKTSRVNLVYRMWDGQSDWNAAVDAAREGK